ncbi:hypothetical protein T439DRAFT_160742 [Meredithblackwellia eburnea MCA 4105]
MEFGMGLRVENVLPARQDFAGGIGKEVKQLSRIRSMFNLSVSSNKKQPSSNRPSALDPRSLFRRISAPLRSPKPFSEEVGNQKDVHVDCSDLQPSQDDRFVRLIKRAPPERKAHWRAIRYARLRAARKAWRGPDEDSIEAGGEIMRREAVRRCMEKRKASERSPLVEGNRGSGGDKKRRIG